MRISIIFECAIVLVARNRFVGSELLEPLFVVLMQSRFIIVNKDACRNMHGIDETEPLIYTGLL